MNVLSDWFGRTVLLCPRQCLLGEKKQIGNISRDKFSTIMVGVSVAARLILKYWKVSKGPPFKEWVNMMTRISVYECMFYKLKKGDDTIVSAWEPFWSYINIAQQGDT